MPVSTHFSQYVSSFDPTEPCLPLVHTSDGLGFRGILADRCLEAKQCSVYGEPLVYYFYGRPAHKPATAKSPTKLYSYLPVSFIVRPEQVPSIVRVAPFDTGAFRKRMFDKLIDTRLQCENFLLEPTLQSPGRAVAAFYRTNKNYFDDVPRVVTDAGHLDFEVQTYSEMISENRPTKYDERCSTVEVQSGRTLSIAGAGVVELVVLPSVFMEDPIVRDILLGEWKVTVRTYFQARVDPRHFVYHVSTLVRAYLAETGRL